MDHPYDPGPLSSDPIPPPRGPHTEAGDEEEVYYEGSPLLRGELGTLFLWTGLGLVLIAAPLVYAYRYDWPSWWITAGLIVVGLLLMTLPALIVRREHYRISNYRIDYERGLIGKNIDTLELWHVDDLSFHQSVLDRLFRVGTIEVDSNDKTTPNLRLRSLPNSRPLFEQLKQRVIAVKRQRGVIKMDLG